MSLFSDFRVQASVLVTIFLAGWKAMDLLNLSLRLLYIGVLACGDYSSYT